MRIRNILADAAVETLSIHVAGQITASTTTRTLGGPVVQYGVAGRTSAGLLKVAPGALRFPADLSRVKLTLEHQRDHSRGHLVAVEDDGTGLRAALKVSDGPEGDAALREAADKTRDGFSFDVVGATVEGDTITDALVIAIGQVGIPAFDDMRIDTIAASTPTPGEDMTPEQRARLAALLAQETRTAEEEAELSTLQALAEANPEPTTAANEPAAAAAPAAPSPAAGAVAASIPAVPAGIPGPSAPAARTQPAGGAFRDMTRRVVEEWTRRGDLAAGITAALSDIIESAHDVIEAPAWSGELWSGLRYEPVWSDLFNTGTLTSWKGEGWRFTSKLAIQDYAGDKAAIPSDNVTTEASSYEAARMAVGVDIDRKFYDFPNEGFITSLMEQIRESWTEQLDTKVRAFAIANAAKASRTIVVATTNADATVTAPTGSFTAADQGRSISGAGIPAATTIATVTNSGSIELSANATATASGVTATVDSADTNLLRVVGRLVQSGRSTKLGRLTGVVMNSDDQFDLLNFTNDDVPKWLDLWNIDPSNFRADPALARGTVYGVVRQAATLRTLPGSPIRVSAQNIANGGVDEAAFGYWAIEEHHPAGILKATYTPAAA